MSNYLKRGNPKKTKRYGNFASPSDLSMSEPSDNPLNLSDNSIDDKNYSPEKKNPKKTTKKTHQK